MKIFQLESDRSGEIQNSGRIRHLVFFHKSVVVVVVVVAIVVVVGVVIESNRIRT